MYTIAHKFYANRSGTYTGIFREKQITVKSLI